MTREVEEYAIRILQDDGNLMCQRPGKVWSVQLFVDKFGIDHVLLRPLFDREGEFLPARTFGFKQSWVGKNRAIAQARLRNKQLHLGSNLPGGISHK